MKLVKPSVERVAGLGVLDAIEQAGRTCYKSECKGDPEGFVARLIKQGHDAMLEFGHMIVRVDRSTYMAMLWSKYLTCTDGENGYLISGSVRAIRDACVSISGRHLAHVLPEVCRCDLETRDAGFEEFDGVLSAEESEAHKFVAYRVVCDRGVSHELVRHRVFSFAQESTRYCNYSGGVTFVIPSWTGHDEGEYTVDIDGHIKHNGIVAHMNAADRQYFICLAECTRVYKYLLAGGWPPQQARAVLPNSLKTEIVMGGSHEGWQHFFKLRCVDGVHPQMREVADMMREDYYD